MARKETPDVLGEVLAGVGEAPVVSVTPVPAPPPAPRKPRSARAPKETAAAPASPALAAPRGWDYLVVSFSEYRGWRPRFINGQEVRNWMHAPLIHDYLAQLGEDGWEMAGAGGGKALYGASDYYQAFFKRAKR
jgi:hypothetical protein